MKKVLALIFILMVIPISIVSLLGSVYRSDENSAFLKEYDTAEHMRHEFNSPSFYKTNELLVQKSNANFSLISWKNGNKGYVAFVSVFPVRGKSSKVIRYPYTEVDRRHSSNSVMMSKNVLIATNSSNLSDNIVNLNF